jgi:two-component system chemotaxis response regulator CheB
MSGIEAVVIGASAGAVDALSVILPALPASYGLPVLVVVHVPSDKENALVDLFRKKCPIQVTEAEDKQAIRVGTVYFAPPDYHLLVERDRTLSLSDDEPVLYSRPSIDVLFETAAEAYGPGLLGIVLTGANEDGANGLTAVVASGGRAIIQKPDTAFSTMMPEASIRACPDASVLSLEEITSHLLEL